MKSLRTISAYLFILLVLFSTTSFMVGVHLCGGQVQAVALFDHAEGCKHQKLPACHKQAMDDCCDDRTLVHEATGFDHFASSLVIDAFQGLVADVPPVLVSFVVPPIVNNSVPPVKDDIPIMSSDRQSLHQVFLI